MYPREFFDNFWRGNLKNEVFVIMPFADEFKAVWEQAIRPAIEEDTIGKPTAHRVDATTLTGDIITEILDGIANAKLIFADISICSAGLWRGQRNGNVMYEVGLAHAIRQATEVIMVRSDREEINFDIARIKIQEYNKSDLGSARVKFAKLANSSLKQIEQMMSLKVESAISSLDSDCLILIDALGQDSGFSVGKATDIKDINDINELLKRQDDKAAAIRLLSLGMLECEVNPTTREYAYHWTHFGKAVLKRLEPS